MEQQINKIQSSKHYRKLNTPCSCGLYCQSNGFSSSHVWIWELHPKEGWALKNWCFWIVMLEKTLNTLVMVAFSSHTEMVLCKPQIMSSYIYFFLFFRKPMSSRAIVPFEKLNSWKLTRSTQIQKLDNDQVRAQPTSPRSVSFPRSFAAVSSQPQASSPGLRPLSCHLSVKPWKVMLLPTQVSEPTGQVCSEDESIIGCRHALRTLKCSKNIRYYSFLPE